MPLHYLFSQSAFDYYEKLRLDRKERKIKKILINEKIKDYYDENGFHIKREYFDDDGKISSYLNIKNLENGDLNVESNLGAEGTFTTVGSQALFYVTYFDPYNLIDEVSLIFDSKFKLIEKRISSTSYDDIDAVYYFYQDNSSYPFKSEYFSDKKLLSKTDYFYDDSGLLIKEKCLWFSGNEVRETVYSYEYFK